MTKAPPPIPNMPDTPPIAGPATGIEWIVSNRTAFLVRGWYERQSRTNLPDQGIANITMSLNVSI